MGSENMSDRIFDPVATPPPRGFGRLRKLRTIDETAELLNVSPRTVRRLIGCLTGAQARPSCSRWR